MLKTKKPLDLNFIKKWMKKGLNPILLSILDRRGFRKDEELLDFFCPIFENIPSPFIFNKIENAYNLLNKVIQNKQNIIIFGDKDVDGTTSTAILYDFLKTSGANVYWEVPTGEDQYGLNVDKIKIWKEKNISLCITVDCGTTNIVEVDELKKSGIDTIIIDHHQPLENLPLAISIINPKLEKNFHFNDIAACGVTFLFIYGYLLFNSIIYNKEIALIYFENNILFLEIYKNLILENRLEVKDKSKLLETNYDSYYLAQDKNDNINQIKDIIELKKVNILNYKKQNNSFVDLIENKSINTKNILFEKIINQIDKIEQIKEKYLPLVMLGLIADIMPIIKINRIFVKLGIHYFQQKKLINLVQLFENLNIDIDLFSMKDLSWTICPVLNASGRMGKADLTVKFFIDLENTKFLIEQMIENNNLRKKKGDQAYNCFIKDVLLNKTFYDNNLAFFYSNEIHRGVTGIIATKLSEEANCPTIVAAVEEKYITGSIRGKSNYHFVDFLDKANNILEEYGGHQSAAGFRMPKEKLNSFKDFLKLNSNLFSFPLITDTESIEIDAEIPFEYLNYDLFKILTILEPFGEKNESPIFYTPNLRISDYTKIGKEKKHLKIFFKTEPRQFTAIYWNNAQMFENNYKNIKYFDVIYKLDLNKFNNQIIPQMIIINLNKSGENI